MKKSAKMSNSIQRRLPIWQTMLLRKGGVSYEEMYCACKIYLEDSEDPRATLRSDKKIILDLLNETSDAELIEVKKNHISRFKLSKDVDLLRLRQEKYYGSEQVALTGMLEQMKGILPEGVIEKVTRSIRKLKREQEEKFERPIVAYEYNVGVNQNMRFFYPIYKAIREQRSLRVSKHKLNDEKNEEVIFYPEFLRQYNTLWYAFGRATDIDGNVLALPCERIALHLITSVKELPAKQYPFQASGIEDYLDEYFSEIVGVDNIASAPVMDVRLAVKNNIVKRMLNNPLHESMILLSKEECPISGYKTFRARVKYNKELMRKLLRMGSDVIVLSPESLQKKVMKEIEKSRIHYATLVSCV